MAVTTWIGAAAAVRRREHCGDLPGRERGSSAGPAWYPLRRRVHRSLPTLLASCASQPAGAALLLPPPLPPPPYRTATLPAVPVVPVLSALPSAK